MKAATGAGRSTTVLRKAAFCPSRAVTVSLTTPEPGVSLWIGKVMVGEMEEPSGFCGVHSRSHV